MKFSLLRAAAISDRALVETAGCQSSKSPFPALPYGHIQGDLLGFHLTGAFHRRNRCFSSSIRGKPVNVVKASPCQSARTLTSVQERSSSKLPPLKVSPLALASNPDKVICRNAESLE